MLSVDAFRQTQTCSGWRFHYWSFCLLSTPCTLIHDTRGSSNIGFKNALDLTCMENHLIQTKGFEKITYWNKANTWWFTGGAVVMYGWRVVLGNKLCCRWEGWREPCHCHQSGTTQTHSAPVSTAALGFTPTAIQDKANTHTACDYRSHYHKGPGWHNPYV